MVTVNFHQYLQSSVTITRGHHLKFIQLQARVHVFLHSFLPATICLWNSLPANMVSSLTIDNFKTKLIHAHHTVYRGLCIIIIITNLRNSSLVVNSASRSSAEQLLGPLGVKIVCDYRFLGGFLGGTVAGSSFILGKVHPLVGLGRQELVMCGYIPDSGCVFYTGEVTAVRMDLSLSGCCSLFAELEETLLLSFLSAMFGCKIFSLEQWLFSLTVRLEGLGLDLPTVSANSLYAASRHATDLLSVPSFLPLPLNPVYMMIWLPGKVVFSYFLIHPLIQPFISRLQQ